jgi:PTH1 family peptidyl-tRNA hydrolase
VKIIVGLGNPGVQYKNSRHNIGFLVVDRIAKDNHISLSMRLPKIIYGLGWIDSERVVLLKPTTYMNRSGEAMIKAFRLFGGGMEDLITIHDDLDLPFGRLRFKRRGGDGGHQGVRSLIDSIGGNNFLRLKVRIAPKKDGSAEYVRRTLAKAERSALGEILSQARRPSRAPPRRHRAMNRFQKMTRWNKGILEYWVLDPHRKCLPSFHDSNVLIFILSLSSLSPFRSP